MSYLFHIDKQSRKVLNPDAVKLVPELGVLDEQEVVCLILAYDYHSPYNQFPEEDRQRKALLHVYGGNAPEKFFEKSKIYTAVEAYKSLQYNPKIELIRKYHNKISTLNDALDDAMDEKAIKDITMSTRELRKYLNELEEEVLGDKLDEGVVMGNTELSWLEKMQQNRDYYLSISKK